MKLGKHLFYIFYNRFRFFHKGISYGKNLKVYDQISLKISKPSLIKIGQNFVFTNGGGYNPITPNTSGAIRVDKNAKLTIGDNCGISSSTLWVRKSITIGNYVLIGGGCLIMDTDCHTLDWHFRGARGGRDEMGCSIDEKMAKSSPIVIEDDVLIGARSIILKGVTIGAHSVVGAGSVVTQSIPPNCIAAGNPAKIIKHI